MGRPDYDVSLLYHAMSNIDRRTHLKRENIRKALQLLVIYFIGS